MLLCYSDYHLPKAAIAMYETNLIEFASKEEHNLLTSIHTYHDDLVHFARVDGHFQSPIKHINVPAADNYGRMVIGLYLFTHYHLYLSFATILRCHLSDSLASTRKAIDATLTTYRLCVEPATLQEYLDEQQTYKFITRTIRKARKKDASKFPLAPPLLELHDLCSQYGSHADVVSFVHRVEVVPLNEDQAVIEHLMFQYPKDHDEFRYYIVSTMSAFLIMLEVFVDVIAKYTKDFDVGNWHDSTKKLIASTEKVRAALANGGLQAKGGRDNEH
jgi:hypothetical protein